MFATWLGLFVLTVTVAVDKVCSMDRTAC